MAPLAFDLLKSLGSGVRAIGASLARPSGSGSLAEGEFAGLLQKARSGELASSRPVTVSPEVAGAIKLTDDQLARLSLAADKAEAQGLRTAMVVLDDQQVLLDIATRTITGKVDVSAGGVLNGFDGVINLSERFAAPAMTPRPLPLPAAWNSPLARAGS